MKKASLYLTAVMISAFVASCGQSEEDRIKDSLFQDSLKKATESSVDNMLDSMMKANETAAPTTDSTGSKDSVTK